MNDIDRVVSDIVERAGPPIVPSRQPQSINPNEMFTSMVHWVDDMNLTAPLYAIDTRARDRWLDEIWRKEPHISGVISQVVSLKKNQGWSLTGGRNQVNRFDQILHNSNYRSPSGKGWRPYAGQEAQSYFTSDLGALTEIGRIGAYPEIDQAHIHLLLAEAMSSPYGSAARELDRLNEQIASMPLGGLYHVDPLYSWLTGNNYAPLALEPITGGTWRWLDAEVFRMSSLPTGRQGWRGVGFCALSRAISLIQIMIGVIRHDKEQLSAAAPAGFFALSGFTQTQWEGAMKKRDEDRLNQNRLYMRDLMVLASNTGNVDAKLISLSQLPQDFKIEQWMPVYMQCLAGAFGYDVHQFYTIKGGSFGVNGQAEIQTDNSTSKGDEDFTLEHQEQIQRLLPETLQFDYDRENAQGDLVRINVQKAYTDMILEIYDRGKGMDDPILTAEQTRRALLRQGVIDADMLTPPEDETRIATDTEQQRARDSSVVRRAATLFPDEPIIRRYNDGRELVVWRSGDQMLHPALYPAAKVDRAAKNKKLFNEGDVVITEQDEADALAEAERMDKGLAALLSAERVDS